MTTEHLSAYGLTLIAAVAIAGIIRAGCVPAAHAAEPPARRVARSLPPEAAERAAARARHNASLRELFRSVGVPDGSDPASVAARAAVIDSVVSAITNRVLISEGVSADAVAAAVRSISTNATERVTQ